MNKNLTTKNNVAFIEVAVDGRAKSSTLSKFEHFKRDRGWMYKTEETLQAGYERLLKCEQGRIRRYFKQL